MIAAVVDTLGLWNWWILAAILLALELVAPTFFFLWLGAAALIVGVLLLFVDWPWSYQVALFAVLSVVLIVASRVWVRDPRHLPRPYLNQRAKRLVGRQVSLVTDIVDGEGQVRIGDTVWRVAGPEAPEGTRVRIVGADGSMLRVEPLDGKAQDTPGA